MATTWLLCSYRLPREPSRLRLAAWRRLKRIGALILHDGLWVLPRDAKTREGLEWLAEEIEENGGSVLLWEAESLASGQDAAVIQGFRVEAEERYTTIRETAGRVVREALRRPTRSALEKAMIQLRGLERTLRLERRRDYFRAPARGKAETTVMDAVERIRARLARTPTTGSAYAVGN
jgi:hypothetical protein